MCILDSQLKKEIMEVQEFIRNYKEAFGEAAELPVVFWYSDVALNLVEKVGGCFFKALKEVREGISVSLNESNIGCGGGKFYTGFADMPEHVPHFVSQKERYKQTPEMVTEYVAEMDIQRSEKKYLNFARIDQIGDFSLVEGVLFLATPDILSGLVTWAYFDNNCPDAVTALFGSGCSTVITQVVQENKIQGHRTFIGFFDPSVRPWFEPEILSYCVPMSRFKEMCRTMRDCCLFGTPAWGKIRERINAGR